MGYYTGLRVRGELNGVGEEVFKYVFSLWGSLGVTDSVWERAAARWPDIVPRVFASNPRSNFIPFGGVTLSRWHGADNKGQEWERRLSCGSIVFQCSVKNYGRLIERFLEDIVPKTFLRLTHAEVLAEDFAVSALHVLESGEVHCRRRSFYDDPREARSPWALPPELERALLAELNFQTDWMRGEGP